MEGSVVEKDRKERGIEDEKKKIKKERKSSKSSVTNFCIVELYVEAWRLEEKWEKRCKEVFSIFQTKP